MEGRLHIRLLGKVYSVSLVLDQPEQPGEGAIGDIKFEGRKELERYLQGQGVDEGTIEEAIRELSENGNFTIYHVTVPTRGI